jgi:hypothetical protein
MFNEILNINNIANNKGESRSPQGDGLTKHFRKTKGENAKTIVEKTLQKYVCCKSINKNIPILLPRNRYRIHILILDLIR